jgi:hypothetical protein
MRQLNSTSTVFIMDTLKNRSDLTTGICRMNQSENHTNGSLVGTTPLFASSLLALFYVLRKNFNKRRVFAGSVDSSLQTEEE